MITIKTTIFASTPIDDSILFVISAYAVNFSVLIEFKWLLKL